MLCEHLDGIELGTAREGRECGCYSPRIERYARLARVRICQRDGNGGRFRKREHPRGPFASQAEGNARPQTRMIHRDGAPMTTYVCDGRHPSKRRILKRASSVWRGNRVVAAAEARTGAGTGGAFEDVWPCGYLLVEEENLA